MSLAALVLAAGVACALGVSGCSAPPARPRVSAESGAHAARDAADGEGLRYEVSAGPNASELRVEAVLPRGVPAELSVDAGAEPFVRDVEIEVDGAFRPFTPEGTSWIAPTCEASGCRMRYRFLLADAARSIEDHGVASEHHGALLAPPSTWLLRPFGAPPGRTYQFRVTTPPGVAFATGVFPAGRGEPGTYRADVGDLPEAPYSAFGPMRIARVAVPGGEVEAAILPGALDLADEVIVGWIASAARVVASYYGRFPLPHALVMVLPVDGSRFGYARTLGNGGASIIAPVGEHVEASDLERDWVMTHEMVHLGFPNVSRRHAWLEEGLATYIEPIARARMGVISAEKVWADLVRGIPKGLPRPGDRGLDRTPTWGRIYWGGALFCLLADVGIRERTGNRRSLDDALRGILAAGGNVSVRWSLERALAEGDKAAGVPVLRELHGRMGAAPADVDLDALWDRLGVKSVGGRVVFDDGAPLAGIRRAITGPPAL